MPRLSFLSVKGTESEAVEPGISEQEILTISEQTIDWVDFFPEKLDRHRAPPSDRG